MISIGRNEVLYKNLKIMIFLTFRKSFFLEFYHFDLKKYVENFWPTSCDPERLF